MIIFIGHTQMIYLSKLKMILALFLVGLIIPMTNAAPRELIKFTIGAYILPDKTLEMQLDVVAPRSPSSYPAILYLTGLSGLLPSKFQASLLDSIAEQGFIVLTVSKLQSPLPDKVTKALTKVVTWISENFQDALSRRAPGVIADFKNRYVMMGHSAAGHVTTEFLNDTCGDFKVQILLDAVDGVDPFGIKKDFIINPGRFLPYAIPVLVLATELDPVSQGAEPPCAPANLSNERFYNAMSGPKWFLNVSKYGHADFLNVEWRDLAGLVCATCHKECNYADFRELAKEAIVNFINGILYKNEVSLGIIEQGCFKIPTSHKHDYMRYDLSRGGFCDRVNQNEQKDVNLAQE